jgi:phosphoglycolate phosphatase-like HAD superfamily hydrolase
MTPHPPLILWDIDGTLVRGKGRRVSVNAFVRALQQASRLEHPLAYPERVAGKTDGQIAREVLAAASVADADATSVLAAFGRVYLDELERQRADLLEDLEILPGVPEVLERLRQLGAMQSLLTGNLEPVARLKLALVQLDHYFAFELGAFGSDHHDRTCLVPIVRQRVQQHLGEAVSPEQIVIVGDTERDIACARAGGVRVVAVATGGSTSEELAAHAPDALLADLRETDRVVATLLRYSTSAAQVETRALIV